jgi:hypothetical protein
MINMLGILLVVQLALTAYVNINNQNLAHFSSEEKIIKANLADADELLISGDNKIVKIKKNSGSWVLPENEDFKANSKKIDDLVITFASLKKSWPVAQSESALKPLKIEDNAFERKLTFKKADATLTEVVLGSSPGFKKVHGRIAGDNTVYVWDINSFEYPTNVADWQDKNYLSLESDKLTNLKLNNLEITKKDGSWTLSDLKETEQVKTTEINALVDAISNMKYFELVGKSEPKDWSKLNEVVTLNLTIDNSQNNYQFKGVVDKNHYYLKRDTDSYYLKVTDSIVKRIKEINREKLVEEKK